MTVKTQQQLTQSENSTTISKWIKKNEMTNLGHLWLTSIEIYENATVFD